MPGSFKSNAPDGLPFVGTNLGTVKNFNANPSPIFPARYTISGITKDSTGATLASCAVELYRTADDSVAGRVTSDASGNYLLDASGSLTHYLVAYKAGSPDVAGTTLNTITGTTT